LANNKKSQRRNFFTVEILVGQGSGEKAFFPKFLLIFLDKPSIISIIDRD
jgi:hypothetical protein